MVLPEPGGPCSSTPRGGRTPSVLKTSGCLSGKSTSSFRMASCLSSPPMSSYPTASSSSNASSSEMGSPSGKICASAPAKQCISGSISTTFHLMSLSPSPTGVSITSPTVSGRIASFRNGASESSNASPSKPSKLDAIAVSMIIEASGTSRRGDIRKVSPEAKRRFAFAVEESLASPRRSLPLASTTAHTVFRIFFARKRTVSPSTRPSLSMVFASTSMADGSSASAAAIVNRILLGVDSSSSASPPRKSAARLNALLCCPSLLLLTARSVSIPRA
mmetsp:Transcript_37086/g.81491  ORF Transcript_37086/g.81491 Transcript_37086/m.81491 type:complete len:276 (+) Transcript_37086:2137-2964(+)